MKRTKSTQPSSAKSQTMTRTKKAPQTTQDGRILGNPYVDDVPENLRDVIPATKSSTQKRSKERKQQARIAHMTRTLKPALEKIEQDGDVTHKGKTFRLKGLNQARFNIIVSAMKRGATVAMACQCAGIDQSTYYDWQRKGEQGIEPYSYVAMLFKQAEAELYTTLMESVLKAGWDHEEYDEVAYEQDPTTHEMVEPKRVTKLIKRDWKAHAWGLERKFPELRLNSTQPENPAEGNTPEQDLLAMTAITLGEVEDVD